MKVHQLPWVFLFCVLAPVGAVAANEAEAWQSMFDGKSLAGWKQTAFDQEGNADVTQGQLYIRAGRPMSGITWQGEFPTTNYEVSLEAMRVDGRDFFCGLTFPVGDEFCSLIVGGWGGGLVGLSSLDGEDASDNETTNFHQFENNRWYRIRLTVTDESIKAWINDQRFVNVERAGFEFSVRFEVEPSRPFGLATYRTTAAYRNLRMRRIIQPSLNPGTLHAELNIPYAGTKHPRQQLDLLLPTNRKSQLLPVIAYIHGGAWKAGDKRVGLEVLEPFVETGEYAGVTIGYRLSGDATWPAQIHDCKAAIRWIRANAEKFKLDPNRIGVMGHSAGGHLAAMLGVSQGDPELEGNLGQELDMSSRVSCVVDFFGPTDLLKIADHPSEIDHHAPSSPESQLLGRAIPDRQEAARSASPTAFVTDDDSPFLIVHGTDDPLVPYQQSVTLKERLEGVDVPAALITIKGGGHGDFQGSVLHDLMADFFATHLRGDDRTVKDANLTPFQSELSDEK